MTEQQPGDVTPEGPDRNNADGSDQPKSRNKWSRFYTTKWFIGVIGLLLGIALGAAGGSNPKESSEYKSVASDLKTAQKERAALNDELDPMKKKVAAIDDRAKKLDDRESALDKREKQIKTDAADVKKREKKVGIVEKEIKNNTIDGNGTYEVGKDIRAGTYKSGKATSGNCYWMISSDPNGSNIVQNNNSAGSSIVSVSKGQYLTLSECDDFVKQ